MTTRRYKTVPPFLASFDAAMRWIGRHRKRAGYADWADERAWHVEQANERAEWEERAADYSAFAKEAYRAGRITVYRAVRLPKSHDGTYPLDLQCLGKSWSRYRKTSGVYGWAPGPGDELLIVGRVSPRDVDWEYGFHSFLYYGTDQWEVSLLEHSAVEVERVEVRTVRGRWTGDGWIEHPGLLLVQGPILGNTGPAGEEWAAECGPRAAERKLRSGNPADGDYQMDHRPADAESGAPLSDVTANGIYPADFYDRPDWYPAGHDSDWEAVGKILHYRGKPDARVRIYRAVPKGVREIRPGDWVAITKSYARDHGKHGSDPSQDMLVLAARVLAKDIVTSGDSYQEWGYVGGVTLTSQMKLLGQPGYGAAWVVFRPRARRARQP